MKRSHALCSFAIIGLALAASPSRPLAAQIGPAPSASPYRDILHGNGWTITAGQVYGDGGPLRLSAHSGMSFGLRYDIRLSGLLQGYASLGYLATERGLVNPDDSVVNQLRGTVDQTVWTPEIGLQLNVTGPKSWHHLAPYASVGLGAAVGESVAEDTTAFNFGTKLLITPAAGVRVYLGPRVNLRIEGMYYYWKMKYPSTWLTEPVAEPAGAGQPKNSVVKTSSELTDWIPTPSLRIGFGLAF
ncbi:MAG TPA: hypothetical protein VL295_10510 [Gemmatimonadales bacterium]|jgi:hypothetical protein|nr:hypothetical protein [Gemmatimonadales bacterium]